MRETKYIASFLKILLLIILLFLIKLGNLPLKLIQLFAHNISQFSFPVFNFKFPEPKKSKRKRSRYKKIFHKLIPKSIKLKTATMAVILILCVNTFLIIKVTTELPSPYQLTSTQRPLTTQIFDRNGKLLYQFYEGQNRKLVKLEELPQNLINATVAIEDKHYFIHPGVDPLGILRAIKVNISQGKIEGGSTITQQLIKNILLTPDQTFTRKAKEVFLAFWAERIYSKKDILQMYFNEAPYGGPAWGVETAAEMYFGKEAKDLTLAECAFLAGLPVAPTEFSPFGTHPEKSKERQKEVLSRMTADGYITKEQAEIAANQELVVKPPRQDIEAPHFVMYIRSILASKYGERTVSQGGLKVTTTLDLDIQNMAENVVAQEIEKLDNLKVGNGAAMVTDAQTGQILAMVGSKGYFDPDNGNFNVALALRQPGSSIKPITYITAFKQGYGPATILLDTPITFPNPGGQAYSPVNYDGRFHGAVTARVALGSSYNIPAVKLLAITGLPAMIQTAKDMGITTFENPENYGLSLTLGGGAVKMIDMMSVYGTFADGGIRNDPQGILEVTDNFGNVLESHREVAGKRVLAEELVYLINHILSDNQARVPAFGKNSLLEIPKHTVAVKTGTSDDKRDNWTFGFTPQYVVGVWVGNNNNTPMDPKLTSGITGAAPIWHNIIEGLLADKPDLAFKRPLGVVETTVEGKKDLGITGQATKSAVAYRKSKQKDETTGNEKEIVTYTDKFSIYTPDQTTQ